MSKRSFIAGIICAYALAGAYCGWATCRVMPDINWMGGVYIGATWPAWVQGWPFGRLPVPAWCFTFNTGGPVNG